MYFVDMLRGMAKMGRPKVPRAKRFAVALSVRLKPAEKREVAAAAKAAGESMSDWAREQLLAAARSPVVEVADAVGIEPTSA